MTDMHAPAPQDAAMSERLSAWLSTQMAAPSVRVTRFSRLQGGAIQDNWTLDVEVDQGPWAGRHELVLRTDAPSGVAASLGRAEEFAVLRVVTDAGVIAPKPLFLCVDPSVMGRTFFVMRRLPGIAAGHRLVRDPGLVPDGDALAEALGANLALIHTIHPPRAELDCLPGAARDSAQSSIDAYRSYLDTLDDAHPALEWGLRWCEMHKPAPHEPALIHRDYRTGNYLVDGGRLAGVLDWEFAGWGDPREDIGWFSARCWRFGFPERDAGGIAGLESFMRGYRSISSLTVTHEDLEYWQVMAHLRWAVIALQQSQRHMRGGERSLELALTGRIVHELEYEVVHLTEPGAR